MICTADLTNLRNDLGLFIDYGWMYDWMGRAAVILSDGEFSAMPETSVAGPVEIVTKVDTDEAEWLLCLSDGELLQVLEEHRTKNELES